MSAPPLMMFVAATCLSLAGCGSEPEAPRGVLLISIDSLRADHLSSFGYQSPTSPGIPTSPSIDRLLSEAGVRFANTYSTTSWTLPSHLAMLSGRPNRLHGVRALPERLPPTVPLVQETFQAAGWRTAGFWSGPNLHPWFGFDRGFEDYVDCSSRPVANPDSFSLQGSLDDQAARDAVSAIHDDSHSGITGPKVVDAFENWFEGVEEDEPFFAFVHLWDVHYDYEPPAEHDVFYPDYNGRVDNKSFTQLRINPNSSRDLNRLISLYDGEIRFTDRNVERLLERLISDKRFDNTLVILTSDHGEAFGEHGYLGHKNNLRTEEVHVPLIMRLPDRIPAGGIVTDPVSLVDLAATMLEFADLPMPDGIWGRSLVPLATGKLAALPERPMPMELSAPYTGREMRAARWAETSVLNKVAVTSGKPGIRIFDLLKDPLERNAVRRPHSRAQTERIQSAKEMWKAFNAAAPAPMAQQTLPKGLDQDLGAAGYITGSSSDD